MTLAEIQSGINAAYATALQIKADIQSMVVDGVSNASDAVSSASNAVSSYFNDAVNSAGDAYNTSKAYVQKQIDWYVNEAKELFDGSAKAALDYIADGLNDVTNFSIKIYDYVKEFLSASVADFSDEVGLIGVNIKDWLTKANDDLLSDFQNDQEKLRNYLNPKLEFIDNKLKQIPIDIGMFVSALTDQAIRFIDVMEDFKTGLFSKLDELLTVDSEEVDEVLKQYQKTPYPKLPRDVIFGKKGQIIK